MLVAVDLDGTIDANPRGFQELMSALKAAGHQVHVVTGVTGDSPTDADMQAKAGYLSALGVPNYDKLVVVASPDGVVASGKAQYLASVGADVLIDNDEANLTAAAQAGVPLCLLPWQSRKM